jgi:hypothetical protein
MKFMNLILWWVGLNVESVNKFIKLCYWMCMFRPHRAKMDKRKGWNGLVLTEDTSVARPQARACDGMSLQVGAWHL